MIKLSKNETWVLYVINWGNEGPGTDRSGAYQEKKFVSDPITY